MSKARLVTIAMVAMVACERPTTGVSACDDHLARRRACAKQIGGELGHEIAREADRLDQLWMGAAKRGVKGWKDTYGTKWCLAATEDARTAFPECPW